MNTAAPLWTEAFSTPSLDVDYITPAELAEIIRTREAGKAYLIVDVRAEFEKAFITGALNLPAHSFYPALPALINVLSRVPLVIFHCSNCARNTGQGPRIAGWFANALNVKGVTRCKVVVLEGGMKEWLKSYSEDAKLTTKL